MSRILSLCFWMSAFGLLITIASCAEEERPISRQQVARKPAPADPAHQKLTELLDKGDLLAAQLLREQLEKGQGGKPSAMPRSLQERFEKVAADQDLEVAPDYLWVHKPPLVGIWQDMLAKAGKRAERMSPKGGIAVLRVRFEDPAREQRIAAYVRSLHVYHTWDDGYGGYESLASGEFLFLGAGGSANQDRAVEIQALGHACPRLPITVPQDGSASEGEVLVRAVAANQLGSLHVKLEPEGGLLRRDATVRVGRRFADWGRGGYRAGADGACTINSIAAGPCDVYAVAGDDFCCPHQSATIEAGKTTELALPLYIRRTVEIEYKYRLPAGTGEWRSGRMAVLSGRSFELNHFGVNGSLCSLTDWDGRETGIQNMNGQVMPGELGDYDQPGVPPAEEFRSAGRKPHRLAVGRVFAVRYGGRNSAEGEAVIRVRSIEPVTGPAASAPTR